MRKFLMVVAVGALALLVAAPAMAVDFKFGAEYRVRFYDYVAVGFDDRAGSNPRGIQNRIRPIFDASDDNGNITARLRLETGDTEWGGGGGANGVANGRSVGGGAVSFANVNTSTRTGPGQGGGLGADGVSVEVKSAYLDFAMPFGVPLRVRAGIQPWYLPKGLIVDEDVAGVRLYGSVKPFSYELFWARLNRGSVAVDTTKDNAFDMYQFKFDLALMKQFNAGLYYLYGDNRSNCDTPALNAAVAGRFSNVCTDNNGDSLDRVRPQHYLGVSLTGDFGFLSYDLDYMYGTAKGGPNGSLVNANGQVVKVAGHALDGGIHVPIGPVRLNFVGSYTTGDSGDPNQTTSSAFPSGPGPSWSGPSAVAGGPYEIIGAGGSFDVVDVTQDGPTNLWTMGLSAEYNPVKALTLRLHYLFAGFSKKGGNCVGANDTVTAGCFGPRYNKLVGTSSLGQEIGLRADYQIWTGFKAQGFVGWLIPSEGDTVGKYILQFLYSF